MKQFLLSFLLLICSQSLFAQNPDTITVTIPAGKFDLAAEIVKPAGLRAGEKIPAVIFVVGSRISSFRTNYRSFWKYFLGDFAGKNGIAVVNFDKRGVGNSTGKWYKATLEDRAADTYAVARYLKKLDYIDPNRIIVIGHSQGGWIVQHCLAHYPDAFAGGVSMAGATFSVQNQLINDFRSELICQENLPEAEAHRRARKKKNRILFFTALLPFKENWVQLNKIKRYDIQPFLTKIEKPLLYMWGENDQLIDYRWCLESLHKALGPDLPTHIETYIGEKQNHSFELSEFCPGAEYKRRNYSEESRQKMHTWVVKLAGVE